MTTAPLRVLTAVAAAVWLASCASAPGEPARGSVPAERPLSDAAGPVPDDWLAAITQHVAPLRHARGGRWPLVLWDQPDPATLSDAQIAMLLERGIVPHLRPDPAHVDAARRIQAAGGPVVVLEGCAGAWPYDLAGPREEWAHVYPADAEVPAAWRGMPVPTRIDGWRVAAGRLRAVMTEFRNAGISVDAVWLDYEGEPSTASYAAALASERARREIPREALADEEAWFRYTRQLWMSLLSAYVAAPVREVFPRAAVTNWIAALSSAQCPVAGWSGRSHPPQGATLFTHSNPAAYAIDRAFAAQWPAGVPVDQPRADAFYTHVMLRQVSADACNRLRDAPHVGSVAWVARWVPDLEDDSIPVMSRGAYREALRHLWLRGVDAMQVFNPRREGFRPMAQLEVVDAAAVYDEMLGWRRFLDEGAVMNLAIPPAAGGEALWSGLRLESEALVRVAGAARRESVTIAPWDGTRVELAAAGGGRTYLLRRTPSGDVSVSSIP